MIILGDLEPGKGDSTISYPWPSAAISGVGNALVGVLPTYIPTGTVATLSPATFTPKPTSDSGGNGWFDVNDSTNGPAKLAGCVYPDGRNALEATVPAAVCTGTRL